MLIDLVVCYKVADDCETNHVLCFRYASAEKFLKDFEERMIESRKTFYSLQKKRKAWMAEQPEDQAKTKEWQAKMPNADVAFEMCGHDFYFWDFYAHTKDDYGDKYTLPKVYRLEDWFEMTVKEE